MAKKASDHFRRYQNPNGPTITTMTRPVFQQDGLKDENGKAYAYRDAAGSYYELGFGLGF